MFSQVQSSPDTEHSEVRQRDIIAATIGLIAEKGMEGLRIRDVADKVGINNATLHYYFKTKETLIEATVKTIVHDLVSTHVPSRNGDPAATPRDELERHFDDILHQIRYFPTRFVVLGELLMRSHHETAVRTILMRTDEDWHAYLTDILERGLALGQFSSQIDIQSIAHLVMMLLKGATLQLNATPDQVEQVIRQVRQWLFA